MNLVHITTLYPGYLADFERRHPEAAHLTFAEHRASLYNDAFGWSNYFEKYLAARGHQTLHLVANYSALQNKWAIENGFTPPSSDASFSIIRAQVKAARPDILFIEDCYAIPPAKVQAILEDAPSISAVACNQGIDDNLAALVPQGALLITCSRPLVSSWQKLGYRAALLRHAFEPAVLQNLPPSYSKHPLTFIGSCSPWIHPERHSWLKFITESFPSMEIWTDSFNLPPKTLIRQTLASLARGRVRRTWSHFTSPLRQRAHDAVFGLPMYTRLNASLVTLNCHISQSIPSAGNMRLFEATGVGACLVTDHRPDLAEIFAPDTEVVTYASSPECIEKIRWLLDHPAQAGEIARRGQQRTLQCHTFAQRALELEALLLAYLAR